MEELLKQLEDLKRLNSTRRKCRGRTLYTPLTPPHLNLHMRVARPVRPLLFPQSSVSRAKD